MKVYLSLLVALAITSTASSQQPVDLTVTLPTGKVVTFQSADQKAKFLARTTSVQRATSAFPTQLPGTGPAPLIALDARSMNGGTSYSVNWMTDYGSYDVNGVANKALDIHVHNLSTRGAKIVVKWIFTARIPHQSGRFIFDMGAGDWDMKPNQDAHLGLRSADLTKREINYAALGTGSYEGAEIDGWLLMATYQGQIIKKIGSTSTLEGLAESPEFSKLVTDYEKATGLKASDSHSPSAVANR